MRAMLPAVLAALLQLQALPLVASSTSAMAASATVVLKNELLSASMNDKQGLLSMSAADGGTPHVFSAGSDGWQVDVSALNSTDAAVSLGGGGAADGGCALQSFRAGSSRQNATFTCDAAPLNHRLLPQ